MIEVSHVSKSFDACQALDDLTLTVSDGSVYGLVGPNGSGKSTLIRHIAGIYRPDTGSICVNGAQPFDNAACKAQIFTIYDDIYHYMHANVRDMAALCKKLYPHFSDERFEHLAQAFPEVTQTTPLRQMSRGMLKQSMFWLALSCCPEVLLLDEPVDGLDPVMRRQVWSLLAADVAERQMTVLLSSHNLRELEDICDFIGVMNKGHVLLEHDINELQDNIVKVQVLFDGGEDVWPASLPVLHEEAAGGLHTRIVQASERQVLLQLEGLHPLHLQIMPLTLEEIFIYELKGADYAVRDILL